MFISKLTRRNTKSSTNAGPGASINTTDYAHRCKQLMALHRDLNKLGSGITELDMPRLTVIGCQSAGKSSLVEAVSDIKVPRDDNTCTRCPTECSMSSMSTSWTCNISLRFSDSSPKAFGPTLTNKKDVEIWLRRAQAAILNPHMSSKVFWDKKAQELKDMHNNNPNMLPFSKDVVHVDVKDPGLTDLSFIDLPGLIQNSDPQEIELIHDLAKEHIRSENTLILVVIPVTDDMKNQAAVRLARDADPEGQRTIGVLTKPDALAPGASGSRQQWKDVIEGKSDPLRHGYYCVRLPDDDERKRDLARADAQKIAAEYFDTTSPWNSIADRSRLGIPNFVAGISGLLVKLIESNLPKLSNTVEELLAKCEEELEKLPAVPDMSNPTTEVYSLITGFCKNLESAILGKSRKEYVQANQQRYADFLRQIFRTRPNFNPYTYTPWLSEPSEANDPPVGPSISLAQVKHAIRSSLGWELPTHVPFDATKNYIDAFTSLWTKPSMACFQDIFGGTAGFVEQLMKEHFGQFRNLESHVARVVNVELEKCREETIDIVTKTLDFERFPLYTLNVELFYDQRQHWIQRYHNAQYYHPHQYTIPYVPRSNPDHDALAVMADVRSYFHVAHKRVTDNILLAIEHELNQTFAGVLQRMLFESLIDAPQKMEVLLAEDPFIAQRRESLEDKHDRLLQIKQRLNGFRLVESEVASESVQSI